jgi:serine/threonine protein kinase
VASDPFVLEGFEPIRPLGGGGFGEVWLARQTNIDRDVAVKVGHAPIDDKTVQMRFERECIALGRLSGHPNIIDVFTAGQLNDGRPYLVLEYISGGTLWQRSQDGPVPEEDLRLIGIQLADALGTAHAAGVLHRDLKPENVLLRPNGEAVLGDFGIARLHDGANTTSQAITASVAYAAPEILSGQPASVVSDVYGVGMCLLAAVIRSVPFVDSTDESIHPIINRVLTDDPPDLRSRGVSEAFAALIARLVAKNPAHRPQTATGLRQLLEQHGGSPGTGSRERTVAAAPQPEPAKETRAMSAFAPPDTPGAASAPGAPGAGRAQIPPGTPHPGPGPGSSARDPRSSDPRTFPTPDPRSSDPRTFPAPPSAGGPGPASGPTNPSQPAYGQAQMGGAAPGSPYQHQRYAPQPSYQPPGQPAGSGGGTTPNRVLVFAAAFGTTVLIGGLLLWALLGGGSNGSAEGSVREDEETVTTTVVETTTSAETATTTATTAPVELPELVLPITRDDLAYGDNSTTDPDFIGPKSQQFCNNFPTTDGLVDWIGETISGSLGTPAFFQELVRFETEEQAAAYVASITDTIDCEEWTVPGVDDGPDIVLSPAVVPPTAQLGDETTTFDYNGSAVGVDGISVHARAVIVRSGVDVFMGSATGFQQSDADAMDDLAQLAAERLGF